MELDCIEDFGERHGGVPECRISHRFQAELLEFVLLDFYTTMLDVAVIVVDTASCWIVTAYKRLLGLEKGIPERHVRHFMRICLLIDGYRSLIYMIMHVWPHVMQIFLFEKLPLL